MSKNTSISDKAEYKKVMTWIEQVHKELDVDADFILEHA